MKLEIECSWEDEKKQAKVTIAFDNSPKSIFQMPGDKIDYVKYLEKNCLLEGPKILHELEQIAIYTPKSIYASFVYFQALRSFEFFEEASEFFVGMKEAFPDQLITKSIEAHYALEENDLKRFPSIFSNHEVLKPAFPNRKVFYFQEAILFHNAWALYYSFQKDVFQAQKHDNFIALIINAVQSVTARLTGISAIQPNFK